jgi:cell division transport system permease protein
MATARAIAVRADAGTGAGSFHFLTGTVRRGKDHLPEALLRRIAAHLRACRHPRQDANAISRDKVADLRARIGVVHQDCQFLDHLPTAENIALPLTVTGRGKSRAAGDLSELVEWVGLSPRASALPPELSGGERQRAALARAVITDPDLILADEPTGNVDWEMSLKLLQLLVELNRMGKTILVATHDLGLIRAAKSQVQARVLRIRNGRSHRGGGPVSLIGDAAALLRPDAQADRVVPRTGQSARLTVFTSAAMAFLAVFALALSLASGRLADRWSSALAQSSTIRLSAPAAEIEAQTWAVLTVLEQTPGVESARAMTDAEQRALLEPWFGPDLPVEDLPIPRLIEITEAPGGYDATGLRQTAGRRGAGGRSGRSHAVARTAGGGGGPAAPLGWVSLGLIAGAMAALITLAAQAALSANAPVIRVLRLVGARDAYIARAFVRRFTIRALAGAAGGAALGMASVALLPGAGADASFLTGLGFTGAGWLLPFLIPPLAALVAFAATRSAAYRTLGRLQ